MFLSMQQPLFCTNHSGSMEPGAYIVTTTIKKHTTVENFKSLLCEVGDRYQLHFGGRCGWNALGTASFVGNIPVMQYILEIGGRALLNLGNEFGWTPLYCAVEGNQKEAVQLLLDNFANPEIATSSWSGNTSRGNTEKGTTPLQCAVKHGYKDIADLLEK